MIPAESQGLMAERMNARVRLTPADHMPMVTAPSAVVDIVLEAVPVDVVAKQDQGHLRGQRSGQQHVVHQRVLRSLHVAQPVHRGCPSPLAIQIVR